MHPEALCKVQNCLLLQESSAWAAADTGRTSPAPGVRERAGHLGTKDTACRVPGGCRRALRAGLPEAAPGPQGSSPRAEDGRVGAQRGAGGSLGRGSGGQGAQGRPRGGVGEPGARGEPTLALSSIPCVSSRWPGRGPSLTCGSGRVTTLAGLRRSGWGGDPASAMRAGPRDAGLRGAALARARGQRAQREWPGAAGSARPARCPPPLRARTTNGRERAHSSPPPSRSSRGRSALGLQLAQAREELAPPLENPGG